MANTFTTNLNLTKPEVGADTDAWGGHLNTDLDTLDGIFAAAGTGTSVGLNVGSGKTLNVAGTFISPTIIGGTTASSALTLESTSGAGTTDSIIFKTGSQSTRMTIGTSGDIGIGVTPTATQLATIQSTYGALTGNSQVNIAGNGYYNSGWKYVGTGLATQYLQNAGVHTWSTAVTGTAGGTISFAESMRIDSSGNLLVGTTTAGGYSGAGTQVLATKLYIGTNTTSTGALGASTKMAVITDSDNPQVVLVATNGTAGSKTWRIISRGSGLSNIFQIQQLSDDTTSETTRMTIDSSGNLLVGTTSSIQSGVFSVLSSASTAGFRTTATAGSGIVLDVSRTSATGDMVYFRTSSTTLAGYITCPTGTTTSYVSVSDYRLKENVIPINNGLTTISALKPVKYDWLTDKAQGEGFIAHELQEVIPLAVTGDKDAVNQDGSIKPQGVDYSKIVVHLVAALQELKAEFDAYKASHA